ncbi:hypothetical protein DBB42_08580 [Pseudomonas plecoglossicida]|uniref:Uncharacterized protein n=1 Tax=Pseudomonas plecoglossicida TaxID=70775 RepID=A0A2R7UN59_PSEDL|nr:hypothetical protein DBB42_08580 [Pseudomonas plecoglossicida]
MVGVGAGLPAIGPQSGPRTPQIFLILSRMAVQLAAWEISYEPRPLPSPSQWEPVPLGFIRR